MKLSFDELFHSPCPCCLSLAVQIPLPCSEPHTRDSLLYKSIEIDKTQPRNSFSLVFFKYLQYYFSEAVPATPP